MTRRAQLAAAVVILGLSLTACGGEREPEPTATSTPAPSVSGPYKAPEPAPAPSDGTEPAPAEADSLENLPADEDAKAGATEAAMATATVWVQGQTLPQPEWNQQLLDTIAPLSRSAYDGRTWGYQVTQTTIVGDPVISDATMTTATVTVPTDDGELTLTVVRADEASPWLTSALTTQQG